MIEKVDRFIRDNHLNFYDVAIMTDAGAASRRNQPCNACNDGYCVAQAFTMTAVGLLLDSKRLNADEKVADILRRDMPEKYDPAWERVTVGHVIGHTMGLDANALDIDADGAELSGKRDYLSYVFERKLAYEPGTARVYSGAAYYLLSRIISARTGRTLDDFLMERVLSPMGFGEIAWSRCPRGYTIGSTGIYARARDIVKLGWLYLNDGCYEGKRVLSHAWVNQALEILRVFEPLGRGNFVGISGANGQMLLFSAKRRFAAAWHSYEPHGADRELIGFLEALT